MMRWGLKDDGCIGLVNETEKDKVLIFKEATPSVDVSLPTLPLIMNSPAEGKAIILEGEIK